MSNAPGTSDRPPPPLGSTPVTPVTDTRKVLAGVLVPVSAVISWLLVTITGHALWWALLVVVGIVGVVAYVTSGRSSRHDEDRDS